MKKVFIVHRWDGSPIFDWYPWVKQKLEERGFQVFVPVMPHPETPTISDWVSKLGEAVLENSGVDSETFFIGHSIGCQTIMRFLEKSDGVRAGGVVFVAPWLSLTPAATPDADTLSIANPWLDTPIDFDVVKGKAFKFVAIFSDNDPYVPLSNFRLFENRLNSEIILESGKGHFDDDSHTKELFVVLDEVMKLSG